MSDVAALVLINCTLNQIANVKSAVNLIEGVIEAYPVSGIYDIVIKVKIEGQEGITALKRVTSRIKKINGVASLVTHVVLEEGNEGGQRHQWQDDGNTQENTRNDIQGSQTHYRE